jgi:ABC-type arginine transport system permease subunit
MSFSERIDELEKQYGLSQQKKCVPTYVIVGIVIPLLIFIVLYFFKPSFTLKEENGEKVRNTKRIFLSVFISTLVAWGLMYAYYASDGFSNISMTCSS